MGRRIVLSLLLALAGLALPAVAQAQPHAAAAAKRPLAQVRGAETLLGGWALVAREARLHGAAVRVTTLDGRRLHQRSGRTTRFGTFQLRLRRPLPRAFLVTVSGGRAGGHAFRGRLRTVVRADRRGGLVHVNPATTVVAAAYAGAPRAGLAAAQRKVRRILSLRRGADLGSGLRRDSAAFDGRRFLLAARSSGGVERYTRRLARRALRGGRALSFRARIRTDARAAGAAPVLARTASEGGIADKIMIALLDGLVEGPEDDAIGWVLDGIGFGSDDAGQLDAIARQLDQLVAMTQQIEQQVVALRKQVAALNAEVTEGTYDTLVAAFPAKDVGSDTDQVLQNLSWLVEHAADGCGDASLPDCVGALPANVDPAGWCASAAPKQNQFQSTACETLLLIQSEQYADMIGEAIDDVSGTAGSRGIPAVFQVSKYASLAAADGFVTEDYRADSIAVHQHFATIEALLADYLAQYWNAMGEASSLEQSKLSAYQSEISSQAAQLPAPLPSNVAIEAGDDVVWALAQSPNIPVEEGGVGTCFPADSNWMWWWYSGDPVCAQWRALQLGRTAGISGWTLPLVDDLASLPGGLPTTATLTTAMRLPDVTPDAAQAPVPAPNTRFPSSVGPIVGDWYPNPGTTLGLMTSNCSSGVEWNSGLADGANGWDSPVFMKGTFCSYVDLRSGTRRITCVAGDPGYYGCDMAVSRSASNRIGKSSGALDYGHPTAVLLRRPLDGSEGWVKTG